VPVEATDEDLAVGVGHAAVVDVTSNANWSMPPGTFRRVPPPHRARLGVDGEHVLGPNDDVTYSVSPTRIGDDSCERTEPSWQRPCDTELLHVAVLILPRLL
jgi:hypothetical protein